MKVHIVSIYFDYEGSEVVGVYADRNAALAFAKTKWLECNPDPNADRFIPFVAREHKYGTVWIRLVSYQSIVIEEWEVQR